MIKVSPSILAADFTNLQEEIEKVAQSAAMLHIDVMDGHFVPNISIGVPVVESIRQKTTMFLDVHLMIVNPIDYVQTFCDAGADLICFHLESESDIMQTIQVVKKAGKKVAIALKPDTPVEEVFPYLSELDMVLIMTVEPGFGGQCFRPELLPKIKRLRQEAGDKLDIQVDGGITRQTAPQVIESGANVLVAGSSVFGAADPAAEVLFLSQLA